MATVKIKFRPSTVDGGQGSIFYQVIHNRVARQQKTGYRLYGYEWNSHSSEVVLSKFNESRKRYLSEIGDKIRMDVKHFQKVIANFEHSGCDYTADDVIAEFSSDNPENFLLPFMEGVITNLKTLGKIRTSETYAATLCSFRRFREDKDVPLDDMDSDMMMAYEAYLKNNGVSPNSSSFYMRNLRAVYNRAVEKGLTSQRFPFKHVYTGVDKTVKRAVPLKVIKKIKEMDFSMNPSFDFARDMFLMSFYTRGMSFVDMAYLRKKDLQNGVLSYRRRKTGQQLFIKWEKCMQEIVDKYGADILRLWVASSDYHADIRISPEILKQLSDAYRKIRNTARYMLGNLSDFNPDTDSVEVSEMLSIDKWALNRLDRLMVKVREGYESFEFHQAYHAIHNLSLIHI